MLRRSEGIEAIGAQRLIAHKGDALRAAYPLLDSAICRGCARRVFEECRRALPDGSPPTPLPEPPAVRPTSESSPQPGV
jgi:hypothetical protein